MQRDEAEHIIAAYVKPVYGFALKRCRNLQDAQDLAQEICMKCFCALLGRDDIADVPRFLWTVAHNALSNYYRSNSRGAVGVSFDLLEDALTSPGDTLQDLLQEETAEKLRTELAYLSKLQREIVIACYYENKKQQEIAAQLGIPLGTVKWHLFEAKKELKKGMEHMRTASDLKFHPICFTGCATNGAVGTKGANNTFFRSALAQNLVYAVRKEAKTVNEIAQALGVSPVYVEGEAEYLEEYGFLRRQGGGYLSNILLDEPTTQLNQMQSEMYAKAAKLFANALYDELVGSELLDGKHGLISAGHPWPDGLNFMLWTLIPYIAARSGEALRERGVSFAQAATVRPDGGQNICRAAVMHSGVEPPQYFDSMQHWSGPCWNQRDGVTLWQIDTQWSGHRMGAHYLPQTDYDLSLLKRNLDDVLTTQEYAHLTERGFLKTSGDPEGIFYATLQPLWIRGEEANRKLLAIGDRLKERFWSELQAIKEPYARALLEETPKHMQAARRYELQFLFYSDAWFLLHCLQELLQSGKLKPPAEDEKKSLTTLLLTKQ